jgi:hypothetical protein
VPAEISALRSNAAMTAERTTGFASSVEFGRRMTVASCDCGTESSATEPPSCCSSVSPSDVVFG